MRKVGAWLADKAGGGVVGAASVAMCAWVNNWWKTGLLTMPSEVIIGGILALVFGGLAVFSKNASAEEALTAQVEEWKAKYEEKNNAAIMRDGKIEARDTTISELKQELAKLRSKR